LLIRRKKVRFNKHLSSFVFFFFIDIKEELFENSLYRLAIRNQITNV